MATIDSSVVIVRDLGLVDYQATFIQMKEFTLQRDESTIDEFWILQHYPVYTQGYTSTELPRGVSSIPVISSDRGGKITYHGPGQLVIYLLLDLKRQQLGVRRLVASVQSTIIELLRQNRIFSETRSGAPGVYVEGRKIASLGFRVSRGCCYHGLSLNVDMDPNPFNSIDPCGMKGLEVTTTKNLGVNSPIHEMAENCINLLVQEFGYSKAVKL